jgi:Ca-activated chloride channel family protein
LLLWLRILSKNPLQLKSLPQFITIAQGYSIFLPSACPQRVLQSVQEQFLETTMLFHRRTPRHVILEQPRPRVSLWWRWFRFFALLFICLLAVVLLVAARSAAASPAGAVTRGELLLYQQEGQVYRAAIQLQGRVHVRVTGMVAEVQVEQRFRNDSDEWLEGSYVFPLPEGAAVNQLRLQIGERVILGEIKERGEAKKIYQQAKMAGKKASLVSQQRPNMFSTRVANIGPGEQLSVQLRYVQRIDYRQGKFSLRFPMTITPRYIPGKATASLRQQGDDLVLHTDGVQGWAVATDRVPDAALITPPQMPLTSMPEGANLVELTAEIDLGLPLASVDSSSHPIKLSRKGLRYDLKLVQDKVPMDRDFLLQWSAQEGSEPQAAVFRERVNGEDYALLMVLPPQRALGPTLPREMIFVIDTSGSMGGTPILQARDSLSFAIGQLRQGDRFNIVEFNSTARALFYEAQAVSRNTIARAEEFVRHLDAGGGTEMLPALELALRDTAEREDESARALRQVIFITDGAVGNEAELFREIQQRLGRSRLFTIGIGAAPNSWFMRKAARFGRGYSTFIADINQVQAQMQALFDSLSTPLSADIRVEWPGAVEAFPQQVPDLYPGEPVLVAARLENSMQPGSILVSGRSADHRWQRQLLLPQPEKGTQLHSGVASLWARQKIEALLDGKILGTPEEEVRAAVLPVALAHQLVSPYTSFVAVEQRISRPATETASSKAVPNLLPAGQSPQPYAWPRTATGAPAQLLLGVLLLMLAPMFWCGFQFLPVSSRRA